MQQDIKDVRFLPSNSIKSKIEHKNKMLLCLVENYSDVMNFKNYFYNLQFAHHHCKLRKTYN